PGSSLPIKNEKYYLLRSYANSAHEVWDVTDPSKPVGVRTVAGGNPVIGNLTGTHKSWWECDTGIAYIVGRRASDDPQWRHDNHVIVFDLMGPPSPLFIWDWAVNGQHDVNIRISSGFDEMPSLNVPISPGVIGNRV